MEDLNAIAADCIVIPCCCQCLILQILIIILLKLPYKLCRKAINYVKKLRKRKGGEKIVHSKRVCGSPFRVPEGTLPSNECHKFGSCMDEVEKVLEEFYIKGEFGFGRFWDCDEVSCGKLPTCLGNDHELDYDVVSFHLIEMFGSFSCKDQSLMLLSC